MSVFNEGSMKTAALYPPCLEKKKLVISGAKIAGSLFHHKKIKSSLYSRYLAEAYD